MATGLGEKHYKQHKEDYEDGKDLDHQPPIARHGLEVLEQLRVRALNIHLRVKHILINPARVRKIYLA